MSYTKVIFPQDFSYIEIFNETWQTANCDIKVLRKEGINRYHVWNNEYRLIYCENARREHMQLSCDEN